MSISVVITPPPTPNGPLHVGHLSGPYVAGDVAVRAARARGESVLSVSGLDVHQNYVLTAAEREGRRAEEVMADYGARIRSAFALAGVEYDLFLDPAQDLDYRAGVARLLDELVARGGAVQVREVPWAVCAGCGRGLHHARVAGRCRVCGAAAAGGACEGCATYAAAVDLVDAACTACGGAPAVTPTPLPVLRMEDVRAQLTEAWSRAVVPARVRDLLDRLLTEGLPDVPLAYPTDWGIPGPGGTRVDVWVEMALGYLYAVPRQLGTGGAGGLADCLAGWSGVDRLWHFLGIDNAFYYGVLCPAVFAAAGMPAGVLAGLVVNEFYALDGLKFSTSRRHAVWAEDFLATEDPALARLYLAWDRPSGFESDFTRAGYAAFRDWAGPLLAGAGRPPLPAAVAAGELARARQALRLETFDPALAARCLLGALGGPAEAEARPLLAALTGARAMAALR
jgi:methionyl-tRNA synthetase